MLRKKTNCKAFITNVNTCYQETGIKIRWHWYKDKLTGKQNRIKQDTDHPD